ASFQAIGTTREIDTRALIWRHPLQGGADFGKGGFYVCRLLLGAVPDVENVAQEAQRTRRSLEGAINQDVRNFGLLLHVVGERGVSIPNRAEVDDEVRRDL